MELTVESLIGELGLELVSGQESAKAHVRWVHSTELADPTPWLKISVPCRNGSAMWSPAITAPSAAYADVMPFAVVIMSG